MAHTCLGCKCQIGYSENYNEHKLECRELTKRVPWYVKYRYSYKYEGRQGWFRRSNFRAALVGVSCIGAKWLAFVVGGVLGSFLLQLLLRWLLLGLYEVWVNPGLPGWYASWGMNEHGIPFGGGTLLRGIAALVLSLVAAVGVVALLACYAQSVWWWLKDFGARVMDVSDWPSQQRGRKMVEDAWDEALIAESRVHPRAYAIDPPEPGEWKEGSYGYSEDTREPPRFEAEQGEGRV